jgi:uncharacterized protein
MALLMAAGRTEAQTGFGDYSAWYTIATAAAKNRTDQVRELLANHRDPDSADEQGRPALIWAVNYDNAAMAKLLLDNGAHVDERDSFGNTALHWAALRGNLELIKLLATDHATIDVQNSEGITPLMQAAGAGKVEAVRLLIAEGADPKKQDYTGRDASGWAAGKLNVMQVLAAKPKP